jgi:aryl-alcohol dehydrogenase-like predicted oxidoreductase
MSNTPSRRSFLAAAGFAAPALLKPADPLPFHAETKLDYRVLGQSGLKVTTMGFGCMITSDPTVIERAADIGVNYFDTARGYQNGNCERMVGAALKARRKNLIVSTKSGAATKEGLLKDLDTSLKELGMDYVDIWYLHGKSKADQITAELMEAQNEAKKAGKIRFAGVSMHSGHQEVIPFVAKQNHFDVVLTTYNFAMEPFMEGLVKTLKDANIGVVAMKVMAGGKKQKDEKTRGILMRDGASLAALKWVLRNKNVTTTIPSITDNDQLEENLKAMAAPFSPTDDKVLQARLEEIRPYYCNMCGRCDGACAQGLPVADMLRFVMYAESYGQFALGRENFRLLPAEHASVRCEDCPECTVKCPHGVRVSQRVSLAQEYFA